MQYYKWIQSNEPIITQIPYYVYTSLEKAYEHEEPNKTLYSFEGLDENIVKQKLLSLPKSASGTLLYLWNVALTQVNDFIITQSKGTDCDSCLASATTLTVSDGGVSQNMTYNSGSGCWETSFPNTLCGATPGLPEEEIIWTLCCVDGIPSLSSGSSSPLVSWNCDPFEAVFGPVFFGDCYLTITILG
jgi:hypothetical protein